MTGADRAQLRQLIDQRRRELTGATADGIKHGTASARKDGCHCQECRDYASAIRRAYRQTHLEQERAASQRYWARRRERENTA